jgi:hypothetical protein
METMKTQDPSLGQKQELSKLTYASLPHSDT